MTYHPLLEDLAKWENEDHFYDLRYFWWYGLSGFNGDDWIKRNLEKDSFEVTRPYVNNKTGETIYEIDILSFKSNLESKIRTSFEKFFSDIEIELFKYDKQGQKLQFINFISNQLEEVEENVKKQQIPQKYLKTICSIWTENKQIFKNKFLVLPDRKTIWEFSYDHKISKEDFNYIVQSLIEKNWLLNTQENKQNMLRFLKKGNPLDKVIWIGRKSYLKSFFDEIIKSTFFNTSNHWIAIEESFLIRSKGELIAPIGIRNINSSKKIAIKKEISDLIKEVNPE